MPSPLVPAPCPTTTNAPGNLKERETGKKNARRRQEEDTDDELKRSDFAVKPRFSQSLHNKGHKGDVDFNVTDHSGDGA